MNLYSGPLAESMGCKTYGIRPEHVTLSKTAGQWQGRIRHVERLGADALIYLTVEDLGEMIARTAGNTPYQPGTTIWATPVEGAGHRFQQ